MSAEQFQENPAPNLMDNLVQQTINRFKSAILLQDESGKEYVNTLAMSAFDALTETGISFEELFPILAKLTSTQPTDSFFPLKPGASKEQITIALDVEIIEGEIRKRHPELRQEEVLRSVFKPDAVVTD